jgi:hypothetical protein
MTYDDPYGRRGGRDDDDAGAQRPHAGAGSASPRHGETWHDPAGAYGQDDGGLGYGAERPAGRRAARAAAKAERARAKALRPWYAKKRWWVLGAIAVVIAIATLADGDQDGETSGDTPAAGETEGGQDVYAIGQTARTGDFDVTLHQVQDPFAPTNEFETPQAGNRFVAVEVEVRNTGSERAPMSTLLGAELTDSMSRPWNVALAGTDLPQLDGEVGPGEARRGWIVFEVAQDATELRLRIKGNLTAAGSLFELG